jgi:hypothetical protein
MALWPCPGIIESRLVLNAVSTSLVDDTKAFGFFLPLTTE